MRGGVAVVTTVMAVIMAAMSGIIGGEIVLLGLVALPQMLRLGYNQNLAIGTICAGGSLGTMIPPSVVLIMFGLITETSINQRPVHRGLPAGAADGDALHPLHHRAHAAQSEPGAVAGRNPGAGRSGCCRRPGGRRPAARWSEIRPVVPWRPATRPLASRPPEIRSPALRPPATRPLASRPPEIRSPALRPPATRLLASRPPEIRPPALRPPAIRPAS